MIIIMIGYSAIANMYGMWGNIMMTFCTLFNSGYLDKGIVMFQSLQRVAEDFKLYVIAFDDRCYEVLQQYHCSQLIPICLKDFENDRLIEAKSNRTAQEYCWTCSCHAIKYVIEKYHEKMCTYIDADMYFYANPRILFEEIEASGCDVSIIEHRLSDTIENRRILQLSGRFCIEFNTFYATENGMHILNWWCDRCLELCTAVQDGVHFGDQKYLDDWETRFTGVHVLQHPGAGVAPWNIARYCLVEKSADQIQVRYRPDSGVYALIFYHFQAMKYLENNQVDVGINLYSGYAQPVLYRGLYRDYLRRIEVVRNRLKEEYQIDLKCSTSKRFSKKEYLFGDIMGERNPIVICRKMWRLWIRKDRDYIAI